MKTTLTLLLVAFTLVINAQNPGGIFEAGPEALHQKIYPVSTVVNDNYVISFGGRENGFISSSYVDVYNAIDNTMLDTPMNGPHDGHAVVSIGNNEYLIIGGSFDLGVPAYANCEKYSSESGLFTPAGNMQYARMQCAAAQINDGRVLIAGGWYNESPAAYPETYEPISGVYTLTGALNTSRAQPVVIPTSDGGAVVAGGWSTYGSSYYTSVEYFDPLTNTFSVIAEEIMVGEEGWRLLAPYTRPIADCQLSNGNSIFLTYKLGTPVEYALAEFDPVSKEFTKVNTNLPVSNEFTDGGFADIVVDDVNDLVYMIGFDAGYNPQRVAIVTVEPATGETYLPTAAFELPASEYFYASYTWLPQQEKIFVHGINATTANYFEGTNKTYLITPSFEASVSEKAPTKLSEFSVYPNPSSGFVNLKIKTDEPSTLTIRLVDAQGRLAKSFVKYPEQGAEQLYLLNVEEVPAGMYQLVVLTDGAVASKSIIIE